MTREEFETCVGYLIETYHLPVDYLAKKIKGFPLNDYELTTPQHLVNRYVFVNFAISLCLCLCLCLFLLFPLKVMK